MNQSADESIGLDLMLITFSGLDGAGKSTLIERLRKKLEAQDRRGPVFHMYRHVGLYACARFLLSRLAGEEFLLASSRQENDGSAGARRRSAGRRPGKARPGGKTAKEGAHPRR